MRSDTTAPEVTVYKGQLVTVTDAAKSGWRRLTGDERQAWYDWFHAECRAGREVWHDSAGESRLAPLDMSVQVTPGKTYQVLRGRVNAPSGYGSVKGCVQLLDTETGTEFYIRRRAIKVIA